MEKLDSIKQSIGMRIKEIRTKNSFTQEKLAELVGINPKYLSNIERGKENPTLNTLITMANSLNVQIHELFDFSAQISAPASRQYINSLIDGADSGDLKKIVKVLSAILH